MVSKSFSNQGEKAMFCPHCKHQDHLEIDLHADGFSSGALLECSACGALLSMNLNNEKLTTLNRPFAKRAVAAAAAARG